jgi:thiamine-monophosphate kinase
VLGGVPRGQAIARGGAQPGDVLYVSGALGDAAAGLAILQQRIVVPEPWASRLLKAFWEPSPALALGAQLRGLATAAVDVSDGLLADAGHLAKASGVKLVIDSAALPLSEALRQLPDQEQARNWALAGGEDYCLCFTLPGDAPAPEGCVGIGRVEVGEGVYCDLMPQRVGYRHF